MLKLLVFIVVMYYVLKVSARLLRTIRLDGNGPARRHAPPPGARSAHGRSRRPPEQPRPRATRHAPKEDVEDAVWEDL